MSEKYILKCADLKGSCQVEGCEDCIELDSVMFGVERPAIEGSTNSDERKFGIADLTEIHVTKKMDKSVIGLFTAVLKKIDPNGYTIELLTLDSENQEIFKYVLTNTIVTSYSVSGIDENLTLNFKNISIQRGKEKVDYDVMKNVMS